LGKRESRQILSQTLLIGGVDGAGRAKRIKTQRIGVLSGRILGNGGRISFLPGAPGGRKNWINLTHETKKKMMEDGAPKRNRVKGGTKHGGSEGEEWAAKMEIKGQDEIREDRLHVLGPRGGLSLKAWVLGGSERFCPNTQYGFDLEEGE